MVFSRWLEARCLFWRASDTITYTTWWVVWLQGKWQLLFLQMVIAHRFDIWDSDIQEKSLCKLWQSKVCFEVPRPASWNFVNIASSVRRPRWNSASRSLHQGILDYVCINVWGPIKTTSIGGNHSFVSFIDDYSKRCWVYIMKHKGEVLEFFVEWKKNMEKNTRRKIKVF